MSGQPADPRRPPLSPRLDRIPRPDPARRQGRDGYGKEALYSTAPTAAPTSQVELRCRRCDVPFGLSIVRVVRLLVPPFLWDPVRGRLWARCPACGHRAWLEVRAGHALRILLGGVQPPGGLRRRRPGRSRPG